MNTPRSKKPVRNTPHRMAEKAFGAFGKAGWHTLQAGVSGEFATMIGALTVRWTHLEEELVSFFARLAGVDYERSRIIFRTIIAQKERINIMRNLIEQSASNADLDAEFDDILAEYASLNTARNKYIHGLWWTDDQARCILMEAAENCVFEPGRPVTAKEVTGFIQRTDRLARKIRRRLTSDQLRAQGIDPTAFFETPIS